jgi:hypothetical protein
VRDTLRQTSANRNKFPKKYFDTQPGVRVGCPPDGGPPCAVQSTSPICAIVRFHPICVVGPMRVHKGDERGQHLDCGRVVGVCDRDADSEDVRSPSLSACAVGGRGPGITHRVPSASPVIGSLQHL